MFSISSGIMVWKIINKAKGQTLKVTCVGLRNDCFSYGQLYVTCFRISSSDNLYNMQLENKTRNVVYIKILLKK